MKLKHDVRVLEMETNEEGITKKRTGGFRIDGPGIYQWEQNNLDPKTRYAVLMVPIPDGHRLAVDGEAGGCLVSNSAYREVVRTDTANWSSFETSTEGSIRIVPIKSERDVKREAVEARIEAAEAELKKARVELGKMS